MELSKDYVMTVTCLAILIAIGTFLSIEIIILHNKYNKMPTKQEFEDLQGSLNANLANIRADVSGLKTTIEELEKKVTDILANAGLTAEQEQEIFDGFKAAKDEAASIAGETPEEPEQPTEETEA